MNTLLSPEQMTPAAELALVSVGSESHQPLLTSQALHAMDLSELARVAGLEEVNDRELLLDAARQVQLQRLGSFISRFANKPTDTVIDQIGTRQFREFDPLVDIVDSLPRYEKVLSRLIDLDTLDELKEDDEDLIDFVADVPKIVPLDIEPANTTIATLVTSVVAEKPLITLRDLLKPQPIESPLEIASKNQTEQSMLKKMLGSINVLSDASRSVIAGSLNMLKTVGRGAERLVPSRKVVAGAGLFIIAYATFPSGISFEASEREQTGTTIVETVPTNTVENVVTPIPATTEETEAEPETTITVTTTEKAPENTANSSPETTVREQSKYEQVMSGSAAPNVLAGQVFAEVDIPAICLSGIDAYGSNRRSETDPSVLKYYLDQGVLSPSQYDVLLSGKASYSLKSYLFDQFDPIYKVNPAETPQQPCELLENNPAYPNRWDRTLIDSSVSGKETENLATIQPVVDINWEGALPGQVGNVIMSGHRTTESAPFANLDQLKTGDEVTITTDDGTKYIYVIESSRYVDGESEYAGAINYVSPSGSAKTITMVTCNEGSEERLLKYGVLKEA